MGKRSVKAIHSGLNVMKAAAGVGLLWPLQLKGWPLGSGAWLAIWIGLQILLHWQSATWIARRTRLRVAEDVLYLVLLATGLAVSALLTTGYWHTFLCAALFLFIAVSPLEAHGQKEIEG